MKQWSCKKCGWTKSAPDHIIAFFHRCRPDGVRRQLVPLGSIADELSPKDLDALRRDKWVRDFFGEAPEPDETKRPRIQQGGTTP